MSAQMISMMRIDKITAQPDRAGRYAVHFSDDTTMRLYKQTIQDFGLYTDMELTEQEYSALKESANRMSAKMRAVRIVSASSVSKRDLENRLVQKGEDPIWAKEAVDWMEELKLLDDEKTAQQIVAGCVVKGYGLARAKQALYEKRIPKEYWHAVLEDYPDQSEAIGKYIRDHLPEQADPKAVKKVIDALLRRGHSYSVIRRVMRQEDVLEEEYG